MKAVAFYLPQFYPIPENDRWWGKGFTEWINVVRARPRFDGHYQPHLPADLGFYDLRVVDTIREQAEMAKQHHIYGFCFYHYWFEGKTLLEKPLKLFVEHEIDFPFCVCWANQNWTRAWDGNDRKCLMEQKYSSEDDIRYIRYMAENYFSRENYICVDEKPVLVIYRTELFPDIEATAERWREEVQKMGFDGIYLVNLENRTYGYPPSDIGFDAAIDFQPKGENLPVRYGKNVFRSILNKFGMLNSVFYNNFVWQYRDYVKMNLYSMRPGSTLFPSIFPMWDNSARRDKGAWIFHNSTPGYFEEWIRQISHEFKPEDVQKDFLFINAWNEWAEGCHLEPCQEWGHQYLEVVKRNITNPHAS